MNVLQTLFIFASIAVAMFNVCDAQSNTSLSTTFVISSTIGTNTNVSSTTSGPNSEVTNTTTNANTNVTSESESNSQVIDTTQKETTTTGSASVFTVGFALFLPVIVSIISQYF